MPKDPQQILAAIATMQQRMQDNPTIHIGPLLVELADAILLLTQRIDPTLFVQPKKDTI